MHDSALKRTPVHGDSPRGAGRATFDIKAITGKSQSYELDISGFMAPGWTGRLTAALAQHRLGIVRGKAERVTTTNWLSNFELKCAPFAKDPLKIDFVALAATELADDRSVGKITLLDYTLEPCSRHDGSLYVEIRGEDRLGFLGDLLDYFSMRCLFPIKMSVDTVEDKALDRFWLRGIGGSVPSESIVGAVKENLEQLLVAKT